MRSRFALLCLIGFFAAVSAQAETRTFIVANYSDGYGVDHCLAARDSCGTAVANSYCRSQAYLRAVSFRKVARKDVSAAPQQESPGCLGGMCGDIIAIECFR
jgi:hypothetical protein